jgi:DNA-binding transcriptional MerR regulator
MKVGEVARSAGVTVDTVRCYERRGAGSCRLVGAGQLG